MKSYQNQSTKTRYYVTCGKKMLRAEANVAINIKIQFFLLMDFVIKINKFCRVKDILITIKLNLSTLVSFTKKKFYRIYATLYGYFNIGIFVESEITSINQLRIQYILNIIISIHLHCIITTKYVILIQERFSRKPSYQPICVHTFN